MWANTWTNLPAAKRNVQPIVEPLESPWNHWEPISWYHCNHRGTIATIVSSIRSYRSYQGTGSHSKGLVKNSLQTTEFELIELYGYYAIYSMTVSKHVWSSAVSSNFFRRIESRSNCVDWSECWGGWNHFRVNERPFQIDDYQVSKKAPPDGDPWFVGENVRIDAITVVQGFRFFFFTGLWFVAE